MSRRGRGGGGRGRLRGMDTGSGTFRGALNPTPRPGVRPGQGWPSPGWPWPAARRHGPFSRDGSREPAAAARTQAAMRFRLSRVPRPSGPRGSPHSRGGAPDEAARARILDPEGEPRGTGASRSPPGLGASGPVRGMQGIPSPPAATGHDRPGCAPLMGTPARDPVRSMQLWTYCTRTYTYASRAPSTRVHPGNSAEEPAQRIGSFLKD